MSRIAIRCALATVFTAATGVAAVHSNDREKAVLAMPPASSVIAGVGSGSPIILAQVAREALPSAKRPTASNTNREATAPPSSGALGSAVPIVNIAEAVQIRFQGLNELTGVYRINEDDTISVPGIGRFDLGTMPAEQLEQTLSKRVLALTGREGMVSIEVERYRQVFVTGDVDKPGSFNWFRGLTVLKAMSLAGGFAREDKGELAEDKGDMVTLQLARALSRHARLGAELAGRKSIEVPERLIGLCGQYRARELITAEENLLDMRRGSRVASLKAIDAGASASSAEIGRLKELQQSLDARYDRYNDHAQSLTKLFKSNVVTKQRMLEVETTLAELSERRAGAKVQLARAVAEEIQLVRQKIELEEVYRARLAEEMSDSWGKIEELQLDLDNSRSSSAKPEKMSLAPASLLSRVAQLGPEAANSSGFVIVRRQGASEVRIAAREIDAVRPGDMLVISRSAAAEGGSNVRRTCGGVPGGQFGPRL